MKSNLKYFSCVLLLIISLCFVACGSSGHIDYDLSNKGQTFTYETIQNVQNKPQNYKGKTFKIRGKVSSSGNYTTLGGTDTTNCCDWTIEIRAGEDVKLPSSSSKNIIVTGTYMSEKKNSVTSYYLLVSNID